jgi:hypothetical protein
VKIGRYGATEPQVDGTPGGEGRAAKQLGGNLRALEKLQMRRHRGGEHVLVVLLG